MWTLDIPGWKKLEIRFLVFDYNGTLAVDGKLLPGVSGKLRQLSTLFEIYVVTADTFGQAAAQLKDLPCKLKILPKENQAEAKRRYVQMLGARQVAAIGNGRNDGLMLEEAALGVALVQAEGAALATVNKADLVCTQAVDVLDLFLQPKRLIATLRG
jgi:soluble P-type ATPase